MKQKIIHICLLLLVFSVLPVRGGNVPQYDIVGVESGNEGKALVKVYVYSKSTTDEEFKQAAVHGVIFRGFSGNNSGVNQPAMASPSVETENANFFKDFFASNGMFQNFATIIEGTYETIKLKKGSKNAVILEVDKTALRKYLEQAKIIKSLSSGF